MSDTVGILNRLHAAESAGVFGYLWSIQPVGRAGSSRLLRDLREMAVAAREHVRALAALLEAYRETPEPGRIPVSFPGLHDVSVEFLLPGLMEAKRQLAQLYDGAVAELGEETPEEVRAFISAAGARHRGDFATLEGYRGKAI